MHPSKWDLVLQRKPTPLVDHLVGELGALFADELARWPPAIDEIDEATLAMLEELIDTYPHRPGRPAYEAAFTLARWDSSSMRSTRSMTTSATTATSRPGWRRPIARWCSS